MNKPFENEQPEFEGYQLDDDNFSHDKEQQLKNWEPQEKPFDFISPVKSISAEIIRSEVPQTISQPWYESLLNKTVEIVSSPEVKLIGATLAIFSAAFLISEAAAAESDVDPNNVDTDF